MKRIESLIKLGILCIVILTYIGKMQNELMENYSIVQKKRQDNQIQTETTAKETAKENDEKEEDAKETLGTNTENDYAIMGKSDVTQEQMVSFFMASGHPYPSEALGEGGAPTIQDYCEMFIEESQAEGVCAEIPYVQSMKETGWLQFEGVCDIRQYNFAGLGATGGDVAGESYPDVRTGIRAQVQHLKAYATVEPLHEACVDTRYELVKKASAPYVQWLGQQENPQGAGWAVDTGYGISIAEMIRNLKSF